ncbi:MAG: hypothetical protein ABI690_18475 [Chloroflexota bacterium]
MSDHKRTVHYFIKYTSRLFAASFTIIILSLLVSGLQPPSPQFKTLEMLHLVDCKLPCWIGIIPGKTTISEARMLIENTYPDEAYEITLGQNVYDGTDWLNIQNRHDDSDFYVSLNVWQKPENKTENMIIDQITLSGAELTLGEWYFVLGSPQVLSVTWGNHYAVPNMLYNRWNVRLTLYNPRDNFAVDSPYISAGMLDLYDPVEWGKTYRPAYQIKWHGFSTSYKDELLASMQP